MKIVLDAGHGKHTAGKRVPDDSMREWEFNNAVALKVAALLSSYKDVVTLFTHDKTGAIDIPLKTRTDNANKWKVDVLVSIHANASGSVWSDAHGIETFIYPTASATSKLLAKNVQSSLVKATGLADRGVKPKDLHIVRESHMPSILVECGFMTNKKEASLLKTDLYRKLCAHAIVNGLVQTFKLEKKPEPKPIAKPESNVIYKVQVGAFGNLKNAEGLLAELKKKGIIGSIVTVKK